MSRFNSIKIRFLQIIGENATDGRTDIKNLPSKYEMDLSGSVVWHACIFRRYGDLSGITRLWSTQCDSLAVAQHDPHGKTKRFHCHFAIKAPKVKMDTMKKQARTCLDSLGVEKKTGQYWITDTVQKGEHAGMPLDWTKLLIYITKGNVFNIKFQHNVSNDEIQQAADSWVGHEVSNPAQGAVVAPPKKEKIPRVPYQQQIINIASAEWFKFKKSEGYLGTDLVTQDEKGDFHKIPQDYKTLHPDDKAKLVGIVCQAMREVSRGINEYLLTDIIRAVLHDDEDYREFVIKKLISNLRI